MFGVLVGMSVAGCRTPHHRGMPSVSSEERARIRAGVNLEFQSVFFGKPRAVGVTGSPDLWLPLFIEDALANAGRSFRMGRVVSGLDGRLQIDTDDPVVYQADDHVSDVDGVTHRRTFVWFYETDSGKPVWRGVRTWYGSDGFPLAWAYLRDGRSSVVFFVSASLEAAAGREFGLPLPGNRFTVERHDSATVVVAGVVEDGPMPMGPYFYVSASERDVTAVRCRCDRSFFATVAETFVYDVAGLGELRDVGMVVTLPDTPLSKMLRMPQTP